MKTSRKNKAKRYKKFWYEKEEKTCLQEIVID